MHCGAYVSPYTDTFNALYPYYLHMGMTSEEYWHGDATLKPAFRKAYKEIQEAEISKANAIAHLQGIYVRDAMRVALSEFARSIGLGGGDPVPYPRYPYPVTADEEREDAERNKARTLAWVRKGNDG